MQETGKNVFSFIMHTSEELNIVLPTCMNVVTAGKQACTRFPKKFTSKLNS